MLIRVAIKRAPYGTVLQLTHHCLLSNLVKSYCYAFCYAVHTFNSCTKRGQHGHNTQPNGRMLFRFLDMDTWMTSQMNVALIRKILGSFFDMLSMGACRTRHWQASGRLVQELNVCTVLHLTHHCLLSY